MESGPSQASCLPNTHWLAAMPLTMTVTGEFRFKAKGEKKKSRRILQTSDNSHDLSQFFKQVSHQLLALSQDLETSHCGGHMTGKGHHFPIYFSTCEQS